jgi:hypothetical protein
MTGNLKYYVILKERSLRLTSSRVIVPGKDLAATIETLRQKAPQHDMVMSS